MRFLSFELDGKASFGVAVGDEVAVPADESVRTLRGALEAWGLDGLRERADGSSKRFAGSRRVALTSIRLLQPITDPDKILCVGLNYYRHAEEAGMTVPKHPSLFVRFPASQVAHGEPVLRPTASHEFDYEAELAVVIGKRGRNIVIDDAMQFIAGYSCFAENSVRDFQRHATQATPGKNFHRSGAFGPWLTTADEAGDPKEMQIVGRLNGQEMQRDSGANMIFSIPTIIAYISSFTELLPGDVLVTGTPAGVGFTKKPPLYLQPGDVFEVDIGNVGVLRNTVVDETDGE